MLTYQIVTLIAINLLYIILTSHLVWSLGVKGTRVSAFGFRTWFTLSSLLTVAKIAFVEYLWFLNRTHTDSPARMISFLLEFERQTIHFLGLSQIESAVLWRVIAYSTIVIVSILQMFPLTGLKMKQPLRWAT